MNDYIINIMRIYSLAFPIINSHNCLSYRLYRTNVYFNVTDTKFDVMHSALFVLLLNKQ